MDTTIGLPPEAKKIAHFVEHERTIEVNRKEKHKVSEEKVDNEVVNFMKRTDVEIDFSIIHKQSYNT